jgi:hypothetical protein
MEEDKNKMGEGNETKSMKGRRRIRRIKGRRKKGRRGGGK